jgi:biopolymer transport protein ExbD
VKLARRPQEAEIPTASMADIAFLLIIFFMVTAVFASTKGLELKLPVEEEPSQAEGEEAVFIQVFSDGSISVDCRPMQPEEILPYLFPKLSRNPEKPVIVYAQPDAEYAHLVNVYDVLVQGKDVPEWQQQQLKVKNISIPTQSDIQDYIALFGVNPFETQCP